MIIFKSQFETHLIRVLDEKRSHFLKLVCTVFNWFVISNKTLWPVLKMIAVGNHKTCLFVCCLFCFFLVFSSSFHFSLAQSLTHPFDVKFYRQVAQNYDHYDAVKMNKRHKAHSPNESNNFISLSLFMFVYFYPILFLSCTRS